MKGVKNTAAYIGLSDRRYYSGTSSTTESVIVPMESGDTWMSHISSRKL